MLLQAANDEILIFFQSIWKIRPRKFLDVWLEIDNFITVPIEFFGVLKFCVFTLPSTSVHHPPTHFRTLWFNKLSLQMANHYLMRVDESVMLTSIRFLVSRSGLRPWGPCIWHYREDRTLNEQGCAFSMICCKLDDNSPESQQWPTANLQRQGRCGSENMKNVKSTKN